MGGNFGALVTSKMAAPTKQTDLKLPNCYKDASKLTKPKLKEGCRALSVDFEKNIGKKALVNIVCNALNLSTSSTTATKDRESVSLLDFTNHSLSTEAKRMEERLNRHTNAHG